MRDRITFFSLGVFFLALLAYGFKSGEMPSMYHCFDKGRQPVLYWCGAVLLGLIGLGCIAVAFDPRMPDR
ncbi:hypothetical protein C3941_22900 [Kaistia algarum]|nr:hypothetical protein C3941_22900 [Kaistia algarum]